MDDIEDQEDDWREVYENLVRKNVGIDDHAKMVRSVEPSIQRLTLEEGSLLDALDEVEFRERIIVETTERNAKKMAGKEARQRLKAELVGMLANLENIVLDLQNSTNMSQGDGEVFATILEKLKERQDIAREEVRQFRSKMRLGPRIPVFFKWDQKIKIIDVLTSFKADMVNVCCMLLCEEPSLEHLGHNHLRRLSGVLGGEWEKVQRLIDSRLQVVTRAIDTLEPQHKSDSDIVTLPTIIRKHKSDSDIVTSPMIIRNAKWNIRVIDLEKYRKQSSNPVEVEENVKVLQRAKDSGAEWLLHKLEAMGVNIFNSFDLWRVRYTVTEDCDSPRYTQGSVAWLCTEHLQSGLEAGTPTTLPCERRMESVRAESADSESGEC